MYRVIVMVLYCVQRICIYATPSVHLPHSPILKLSAAPPHAHQLAQSCLCLYLFTSFLFFSSLDNTFHHSFTDVYSSIFFAFCNLFSFPTWQGNLTVANDDFDYLCMTLYPISVVHQSRTHKRNQSFSTKERVEANTF